MEIAIRQVYLFAYLQVVALILVQSSGPADESERARRLVVAGKPNEAIPIYESLVHDFPSRPDLLLNLSIAEFNAKQFAAAARHAESALELNPDLAAADLFLGASKLQLHDDTNAIDPLKKAVAAMPGDRNARLMLAEALLGGKRYNDAVEEFGKASELVPENPRVWYGLGQAYDAQGKYREATGEFRKALKLMPGDTNARLGLARALFHSQEYEEALSILNELLRQKPDLAEAEFLAGASLLNLQQPHAAAPHLERSLKVDPQFLAAAAALGQALLQDNKPEQAIPYLKSSLSADTDGNAHYQLFRAYQLTGNRQLAKAAFDAYTRYRAGIDQNRRREDSAQGSAP